MKQELYLNKVHKWNEIWNEIRQWIEHSPHSNIKNLPTKVARGEWGDENERVKITPVGDKRLIVTYTKVGRVCPKPPLTWTTRIDFKRAKNSIYTCVEVSADRADVEIKTPRIIAILKKRFGDMNPKVGRDDPIAPLVGGDPRAPRGRAVVPPTADDRATKADLKAAVSEIKSHIDSKASSMYEHSDVKLSVSYMASALGYSERQMRRKLEDEVWKKKVAFPGAFLTHESFADWAKPFRKSRVLSKGARDNLKNQFRGAKGKRKTDW